MQGCWPQIHSEQLCESPSESLREHERPNVLVASGNSRPATPKPQPSKTPTSIYCYRDHLSTAANSTRRGEGRAIGLVLYAYPFITDYPTMVCRALLDDAMSYSSMSTRWRCLHLLRRARRRRTHCVPTDLVKSEKGVCACDYLRSSEIANLHGLRLRRSVYLRVTQGMQACHAPDWMLTLHACELRAPGLVHDALTKRKLDRKRLDLGARRTRHLLLTQSRSRWRSQKRQERRTRGHRKPSSQGVGCAQLQVGNRESVRHQRAVIVPAPIVLGSVYP